MRTVQMTLIEGDPTVCEQTKTSKRKCDTVPGGGAAGRGKKGRKGGRGKNKKKNKNKNGKTENGKIKKNKSAYQYIISYCYPCYI